MNKIKKETNHITPKQLQEFDEIRKKLLASGKDLTKIKITTMGYA